MRQTFYLLFPNCLPSENHLESILIFQLVLDDQIFQSESMSKKGKDFVSTNFNWDKICHDFLDCLKNMI